MLSAAKVALEMSVSLGGCESHSATFGLPLPAPIIKSHSAGVRILTLEASDTTAPTLEGEVRNLLRGGEVSCINELKQLGMRPLQVSDQGSRNQSGVWSQGATSKRYQGNLALLLSDVSLPKMKGPAMAKILLEQRPTMKVLFMSGHSDVILLDRARVIAAIRER